MQDLDEHGPEESVESDIKDQLVRLTWVETYNTIVFTHVALSTPHDLIVLSHPQI